MEDLRRHLVQIRERLASVGETRLISADEWRDLVERIPSYGEEIAPVVATGELPKPFRDALDSTWERLRGLLEGSVPERLSAGEVPDYTAELEIKAAIDDVLGEIAKLTNDAAWPRLVAA